MANRLKPEKQLAVLAQLVEGSSIRSTERITGIHRDTICRLIVRFGVACQRFLDSALCGLTLNHVECDEIWTFVQKKQGRLTVEEKERRHDIGDIYLWTALDQDTKLVPAFTVGKRSADNARRFLVDLAARLHFPVPHESDDHAYQKGEYRTIIQLSTDGFVAYPEAIDLAFGPYASHGVLIKDYRNADQPGRYAPPEMISTSRRVVRGDVDIFDICTSHVERHNLTIRTFLRRFTRLALGFSKKLENLEAATTIFLAYYNFCWRPRTTGVTPAMAAGVEGRLWKLADLYEAALSA